MPQKLHNQTANRADLTQAINSLIIALGDRSNPSMVGCYNITYENFYKLILTTIQAAQEINKSSALNFSFRLTGNAININNTTNEIRTISNIGIQGGCFYIMDIKAGQKIIHLASASTTNRPIRLHTNQNWTATRDTSLLMWYDSENQIWKVVGDALSDLIAESTTIIAIPKNANAYNLASGGNITGWLSGDLTGYTVTNEGSATVSIIDDTYISCGIGSIYGIKVFDYLNNLIHEFACCENNVNIPYLHCSVTGRVFYITNTKTVIKQDTYFKCQENGFQIVTITETGDVMDVAYLNDKITKIYN